MLGKIILGQEEWNNWHLEEHCSSAVSIYTENLYH